MVDQTPEALALIAEAAKYPSLDELMRRLGPETTPEQRHQLIIRWREKRAALEYKKQQKEEDEANE